MYMELPPGIETKHGNPKDYMLKLLTNLYGQKQAGHVWNQYITDKQCDIGFQQSLLSACFTVMTSFSSNTWMMVFFLWQLVQASTLKIKAIRLTTLESTSKRLMMELTNLPNALYKMPSSMTSTLATPTQSQPQLRCHSSNMPFLNYLGQTTRPDILYAVHQVAKCSSDPRLEHGEVIVHIVKYLKATHQIGLCFKPDASKDFQCYCDADFA
ncbi:hypothetical protein ACHAW6_009959 [Cyclotella cf. meneghiniana]